MAQTQNGFSRVLSTRDVLMVAFGAMIGWGWVVSSGQWIQTGGAIGTAIAFCIGGIMIYLVGLTYAELTTAMPKVGGEQNFSYAAFGPAGSYICIWALVLSYIGVVCFEACSFATIMQYLIPGFLQGYMYTVAGYDVYLSWVAVAILASLLILYINYIGTKRAAKLQNVLTCVIAGVGLLLVAGSAVNGEMANLSRQPFVGEDSGSIITNVLKVAIMTPFFLFGFDVIPQAAEEINVPLKRLGRLMVASIGLAVVFYALIVVAIGYVMTPEQIDDSMKATGMVTADAFATAFSNQALTKVLIIGGLCGIVTTWNSFLIGGSRVLFSMSNIQDVAQQVLKATFRIQYALCGHPVPWLALHVRTAVRTCDAYMDCRCSQFRLLSCILHGGSLVLALAKDQARHASSFPCQQWQGYRCTGHMHGRIYGLDVLNTGHRLCIGMARMDYCWRLGFARTHIGFQGHQGLWG